MSDVLSTTPLAGCTVVVTRPAGTSNALLRRVRALGGAAVALPGLALRACRDADADIARAALAGAATADLCLFTSPAAVRFAFQLAPAFALRRGQAACGVGAGTQRALARHGVTAFAPRERSDSEGLLALPELAAVRGQRVALIGAPGGRGLLAATLRQRGAEVVAIHVYTRVPPRLHRRHFDALARAVDPLVMPLSSAEALDNLVALLPPPLLARLRRQSVVASSARLAALAAEHGFDHVTEAASALPEDLLAATRKVLAQHRL